MPTALFVSPHLDDVAFSCGATVSWLASQGWRCVLATAFTRSVHNPTGFALACQTDKGLPVDVDYMALRRQEDAACGQALGIEAVRWLDFAEAPHRGYDSAAQLFALPHMGDSVVEPLSQALCALCSELQPAITFAPLALGAHVDHVQLQRAVRLAVGEQASVAWYRDMPYAMRAGDDTASDAGSASAAVAFGEGHLQAKLDGCACYGSQLGFQFGDVQAMYAALTSFAYDEGRRARLAGRPAERFVAAAAAAQWLEGNARTTQPTATDSVAPATAAAAAATDWAGEGATS